MIASKRQKLFVAWLSSVAFVIALSTLTGGANELTVALSTFVCGITTLVFWLSRDRLVELSGRWKTRPGLKFVLAGALGAAWVEFVFWGFERVLGAEGIAASPDLLVDYVATMPWYLMMLALLWRVVNRYRYSPGEILFLGGIYELGADGLFAPTFAGQLTFSGLMATLAVVPLFVVVYSPMVLPPVYLLSREL
ncbi:MAG: hypothetical protein ACE5IB_05840, partial [Candidatus Geothermarchaeales archaeon]